MSNDPNYRPYSQPVHPDSVFGVFSTKGYKRGGRKAGESKLGPGKPPNTDPVEPEELTFL